jgi:hypothetical protein
LYKLIYQLRFSIDKKHRFGIHVTLEQKTVELLTLIIASALIKEKSESLKQSRILIETIRHLVRLEHELEIIPVKKYFIIIPVIEELSKMTTGWYKTTQQ